MNLSDRNAELDKARALKVTIEQAEARLDATDGQEGALKDELQDARKEFNALMKNGQRGPPRKLVLNDLIHELHDKLHALAHEPSTLQNTLRRLGSDFGGFSSRDWQWLDNWRIGREHGMGGPVDVENEGQCKTWLNEARTHAVTFLNTRQANRFIVECKGKLDRRRRELVEGRARNAETDARARALHAELVEEKKQRAEENRVRLAESDKQRADFRAELDRGMAEARVADSLAFDRRVARKEVRRHTWLTKYWTKIAKARDDEAFREEWLLKLDAKNPERAKGLRRIFRSVGDAASALRGAEQFDLIRQRWDRVVEQLDADPTLTMDEAEEVADPEYREEREEIKEREQARLDAHNADQNRQFDEHQQRARDAYARERAAFRF